MILGTHEQVDGHGWDRHSYTVNLEIIDGELCQKDAYGSSDTTAVTGIIMVDKDFKKPRLIKKNIVELAKEVLTDGDIIIN